jgi:hypothetical protein
MFVAFAAPASAQVRVDVGVMSANIGARVVVGGPRVVYVPVDRYREPVYSRRVVYPRRDDRYYRGRNWDRRDQEYYQDVREARRDMSGISVMPAGTTETFARPRAIVGAELLGCGAPPSGRRRAPSAD